MIAYSLIISVRFPPAVSPLAGPWGMNRRRVVTINDGQPDRTTE
jgi:hypothetical protein